MLWIVPATVQDIPTIQAIAHNTWPVAYSQIISQAQIDYMLQMMYSETSLIRQMTVEACEFLMIQSDAKTVGFAGFSREDVVKSKLHKLYVLPEAQGIGAGKQLLEEVCVRSATNGAKALVLQVNKRNKARFFYERNGFEIEKEIVVDIGGGFVMDDYIMKKQF